MGLFVDTGVTRLLPVWFKDALRPLVDLDVRLEDVVGATDYDGPPNLGVNGFSNEDLKIWAASAVFLFILRRVLVLLVFSPLANRWKLTKRQQSKFCENAWYCFYYPLMVIYGASYLRHMPWSRNLYYATCGAAQHILNERPVEHVWYYMVSLGFYTQASLDLVINETRRKDFGEMIIHHAATGILVSVSWASWDDRIGSLILLLHDVSDVFLYSTKVLHYANFRDSIKFSWFVVFVISFFVTRMVYFPFWVFTATYWVPNAMPSGHYWFMMRETNSLFVIDSLGVCAGSYCMSSHWSLVSLLVVLILLHTFWFSLILRMIVQAVNGSADKDIRSSSDDEGDDPLDDKKRR